jgi:hypothetical protein
MVCRFHAAAMVPNSAASRSRSSPSARERDALRALARAPQAEAEIRFGALAPVGGAHQPPAEQEGDGRARRRVEHREPDHVARHRQPKDLDRAGERPEDASEGDEQQRAVEQRLAELDGRLGGDADVLGDAPVRVVVVARHQRDLVVPRARHPAADDAPGERLAPGELDAPLDHQIRAISRHAERNDQREDRHLLDEVLGRAALQRVEQLRRPEIDPHRQQH